MESWYIAKRRNDMEYLEWTGARYQNEMYMTKAWIVMYE